ncbi:FAD-binding oxidoreductase [Affinibrenneria salicis]|uniref:FAD-binding oxidoreductase n=1 Tax=Affinibrenneria salicis TaxID=2590031 RepID=A0A5J5G7I8_9GAMM|nr:FAD-dependent oxidoreductase [Affinibrenneria salicis]KAA9002780.1 FAD-binding oxidoreductase [Affinibrenneria salicis]KAA9002933.1 FAD-binding oxidoreductase [Affinibrenneria salicis]
MSATEDFAVIGGGIVGLAIAYGLRRRGLTVTLYDGGDNDFRASRGNFGLAWVQGKGEHCPQYSELSRLSSERWQAFADALLRETGIDCEFRRPGGINICLDGAALEAARERMETIYRQNRRLDYQIWPAARLRRQVPAIADGVAGAIYSPHDGHANPLNTLRALIKAFQLAGGVYLPATPVREIGRAGQDFILHTERGVDLAGRVILASGLENTRLGAQVGLSIPIEPVRGQILVTERLPAFLPYPTSLVRQTGEGSVLIGDSQERVGLNTDTRPEILSRIARRALSVFPLLSHVRVVRAWGALRIMTPDGLPVYGASVSHPGAFAVTCHSGVTLAPLHSTLVADWIAGDGQNPLLEVFNAQRFAVQTPDVD